MKLGLVAALGIWLCLVSVALADDMIQTIALSGRPLPGFGNNLATHTTTFRDAVLNNRGQVAYSANITFPGTSLNTRESYWRYTPGTGLDLIALSGDPAPGRPGDFFTQTLGPVHITDAGDVQLRSHLFGANANGASQHLGDWVWTPNTFNKLAFINERTPQLDHYFQAIGSAINELGQQVRGARNRPLRGIEDQAESLWFLDPNSAPRLLAKVGDPAPGLPGGITLARQFTGDFLDSGKILYRMGLAGPGVNTVNGLAFWVGDSQGNLQLMFRSGQQAPGLPTGVLIDASSYGFVLPLGTGGLQIQTLLQGPGISAGNSLAIWSYDEAGMKLLARKGDPAPGLELNSAVFAQLVPGQYRVTGLGIDTSNDMGLWLQQHGGFELVVREGQHAPGTPVGVGFASVSPFGTETFTSNVVQNQSEQFAFLANLKGSDVTDGNDVGIWASDRSGVLHLIAREGQELDVDDGPGIDMRTIATLDLRQFDTADRYLNDRGQVLFKATFTDGAKGIILSNLVAVPEPASFAACAIFGVSIAAGPMAQRRLTQIQHR